VQSLKVLQMTDILVLLRPSSFHRHCGGWLPSNHHCHRGVVQYSRRSFRRCFLKTAVCRHYLQSSYIVSKCRVTWSHTASPWHRPSLRASPSALANDTMASTFSVASQTAFVCSCRDSRDALGAVLNQTVVTVSFSTAPRPSIIRWRRAVHH